MNKSIIVAKNGLPLFTISPVTREISDQELGQMVKTYYKQALDMTVTKVTVINNEFIVSFDNPKYNCILCWSFYTNIEL